MKRHNESSEDEREPKRAKIANLSEDPLLPPEILQKIVQYACHEDFKASSCFLQSAKLFEDMLSEKSWKFMFVFRIISSDGIKKYSEKVGIILVMKIEKYLSVEPNDYVDKPFYENNAWKNRYKYRAHLESLRRRVSEKKLSTADLRHVSSCSFTFYRINKRVDRSTKIQYSNLAKIEALNKRYILEFHARRGSPDFDYDDRDKSLMEDVCHYILIARTGAPVKVRLEIFDGWGSVKKKYVNTRVLAYNYKNQIWDIISAQYCNFAIEEDVMNYYEPYCTKLSKALFVEKKSETSDEKDYNGDVYRVICAAAQLSEEHIHSNGSTTVDLNAVNEQGEEEEPVGAKNEE